MSNEKKLAITSDIVFSLDTKIKGKDYVYEVARRSVLAASHAA